MAKSTASIENLLGLVETKAQAENDPSVSRDEASEAALPELVDTAEEAEEQTPELEREDPTSEEETLEELEDATTECVPMKFVISKTGQDSSWEIKPAAENAVRRSMKATSTANAVADVFALIHAIGNDNVDMKDLEEHWIVRGLNAMERTPPTMLPFEKKPPLPREWWQCGGRDFNCRGPEDFLFEVSRQGNLEIAKYHLEEYPGILNSTCKDHRDDGATSLMFAALYGHTEFVKFLLKQPGINVTAISPVLELRSALFCALEPMRVLNEGLDRLDHEMVHSLIAAKADINQIIGDTTVLLEAWQWSVKFSSELIYSFGADIRISETLASTSEHILEVQKKGVERRIALSKDICLKKFEQVGLCVRHVMPLSSIEVVRPLFEFLVRQDSSEIHALMRGWTSPTQMEQPLRPLVLQHADSEPLLQQENCALDKLCKVAVDLNPCEQDASKTPCVANNQQPLSIKEIQGMIAELDALQKQFENNMPKESQELREILARITACRTVFTRVHTEMQAQQQNNEHSPVVMLSQSASRTQASSATPDACQRASTPVVRMVLPS